jgi:hypothetical protein
MGDAFLQEMGEGYTFDEPAIVFGGAMLGDEVDTATRVFADVKGDLTGMSQPGAVGVAKDMLTTEDGRRTLRSVFRTLVGK